MCRFKGAYGSCIPVVGSIVGAALGAIVGGVIGIVKTGKHIDQVARDNMRQFLCSAGIINNNYCFVLADGSLYDMGKDGGFRLQNVDGGNRAAYEIDFSHPAASEAIGWAQPIAAILTNGNKKLQTDLTGYFVNAALSNASDFETTCKNIQTIFAQTGLTPEVAMEELQKLAATNKLSKEEAIAYIHGLDTLLHRNNFLI